MLEHPSIPTKEGPLYMDFPYRAQVGIGIHPCLSPEFARYTTLDKNSSHFEPKKKLLGFCGCFAPDFQVPNRFCGGP